ncbi:MAG: DUF1573 domain-containing protein [Luteolibacter sp.]
MRFAILWLWACAAWLQAGELAFPETSKELHPAPDAKTISVDFDFKNETDKPLTIAKYETACSCMSLGIAGNKMTYAPGESGKVEATFDMGNFSGEVDKEILLWMRGDPADRPSRVLKVRVNIPVLVSIEPRTVRWQLGEKPASKTLRITMKDTKPVKILDVSTASKAFQYELKTLEEGKTYELVITPASTAEPNLAVFRIKTDCSSERHRVQQAFAIVPKNVGGNP